MAAIKKPLQALLMSPSEEQWESILSEKKKITIREGNRDYHLGAVIITNPERGYCLSATIAKVNHYVAREVPEQDFMDDGYKSRTEMISDLRKFYPDLTPDSEVTVIRWDNIQGRLLEEFLAQRPV